MSNIVTERVNKLRKMMSDKNMSVYMITMADFHHSEYVGDYFMEVRFMSGFSGTNATVVVTPDKAGLWTDGRYFIQAKREIDGSCVELYPMGEDGVPSVLDFIREEMKDGTGIGFDGRCITVKESEDLSEIAKDKNGSLMGSEDLVDTIWTERPELSSQKVWELEDDFSGETRAKKLSWLRLTIKEQEQEGYLLNDLCSIAWLLNLRGDDIESVPVFLSYFYISKSQAILFTDPKIISNKLMESLYSDGIRVLPYESVFELTGNIPDPVTEKKIWIDHECVTLALKNAFPKETEFYYDANPIEERKSIRNPVEIKNTRLAHIKDGTALTHFIYWLKNQDVSKLSEVDCSDRLLEYRKSQKNFLDVSFDTIAAYGPNAAMMHYSATPEKYSMLEPKSFILVDSGGHYLEGTTDVTRTIVVGSLTDEEKEDYTTVLRCHLRLMAAHFLKGCTGQNLDILSREPVWERGLDYRCGTGHGVGHISNVHEGPNSFRWRITDKGRAWTLKPGQITTDKPGLYIEDGYGIRIENELLCHEDVKTEYGQFYSFETITYAPIDLEPVIPEMLTQYERATLNAYHKMVFDKISSDFTGKELEWLKAATREI